MQSLKPENENSYAASKYNDFQIKWYLVSQHNIMFVYCLALVWDLIKFYFVTIYSYIRPLLFLYELFMTPDNINIHMAGIQVLYDLLSATRI